MKLLRASSEATGTAIDIDALQGGTPGTTDVDAAAELLALADAIHGRDTQAIASARGAVEQALGPDAAVDACAVAAAFYGNNIVTASTGCRVPDAKPSADISSAWEDG